MIAKGLSTNKPKNKCDIVVEEILSKIARGEYKENEKLPPESYFVEYFGYSRVTIRESFKKLNTLGVVTIKQGEGTFVGRADFGTMMQPLFANVILDNLSVNQLYDARLYVESGTAKLTAQNRTQEDLEKLEQLMDEMRVVVAAKDSHRFSQLDILFHETIAETSRNPVLSATYKTIKEITNTYIVQSNLSLEIIEQSMQHHIEIVDAIRKQDASRERTAMEHHVESTKQSLIQRMLGEGVPGYVQIEE